MNPDFSFGAPDRLWLLLALVPLSVLIQWFNRRRRKSCDSVGLSSLHGERRAWLHVFAIGLSLLAFSRPQWGERVVAVPGKQLAVVAVLDASPSMMAADVFPSRMVAAQRKLIDVSERLEDLPMGLVAFSGGAYARSPLTRDKRVLEQLIMDTTPDMLRRKGSDLGAAIEVAQSLFDDDDSRPKAILVFSDGEDHAGGAASRLEQLAASGIPVFTLGFGELQGAPIPMDEGGFLSDPEGSPIISKPNLELLDSLASATGGMSLHADIGMNDVDELMENGLLPIAKQEAGENHRVASFGYIWPLLIAFTCLFFFPISIPIINPRLLGAGAGLITLFILWPPPAQSEDKLDTEYRTVSVLEADAIRGLKSGDSALALNRFNRLLLLEQSDSDRQRTFYNAGLAAYGQGQLHLAYRYFMSATDLGPHSRAESNATATLNEIGLRLKNIDSKQESEQSDQNIPGSGEEHPSGHENADGRDSGVESSMNSESGRNLDGRDDEIREENSPWTDSHPFQDEEQTDSAPKEAGQENNVAGSSNPLSRLEMNLIRAERILNSAKPGRPHHLYGDGDGGDKPW